MIRTQNALMRLGQAESIILVNADPVKRNFVRQAWLISALTVDNSLDWLRESVST